MASLWRGSTITNLKKFIWSQRKGSAEQFKKGGAYVQSGWELESMLLLRHSSASSVTLDIVHVLATCQERAADTLPIKNSKCGSGSPSALQVQLTTANRSCRNMPEAQSQPHSWQDQFALSSMTLSSDDYLACLTLPGQTSTNI